MSWFDEQLRSREEADEEYLAEAVDSIASAVMGKRLSVALSNRELANSAIEEILKFYNCKTRNEELPPSVKTVEEQLEFQMRRFGIMHRSVELSKGWYKDAVGAMLGTLVEDNTPVALIPDKISGYSYVDIKTGKKIKVNRRTEKLIDKEAVCFYQPLPQKALNVADLFKFMYEQLSLSDVVMFISLIGISALVGLLTPFLTKWLFGEILDSGSVTILIAFASFMVCFSVSQLIFSSFQTLVNAKITTKQKIAVQAAVMSRVMNMPASFFKNYSSGELNQRANYVQSLCSAIFETIGTTGFTAIFSLIYVGQIFTFAPSLVIPAIIIILASVIVSVITTLLKIKSTREYMIHSSQTSGLTYATITGIQKIKLAGAEKRIFSRWAKMYSREVADEYNPTPFVKMNGAVTLAITLTGTLVIYAISIKNNISVANYYAFNSAFAIVSSAFMAISTLASSASTIKPSLEMAKPILETEPETSEEKEIVTHLRGAIELSNVSFKYDESMPNVIDNLSMKIKPGEFLAVVGSTGCGKSTLLRLLLGFEKPQKGSIYFDRKDINRVDLRSLRQNIGTVMQDGKLFFGDIYSNIVVAAPHLTVDDAWEAAEIASVAEDIRNMPMKMHTIISDGQGGISGGQRQRLMIARAVAPKPKILMFDEATSALDNVTQKKVSDAIDSLKCTRIIIAHRLSTIRHADRIIFLDKGKIAEEGTYEELIEKNGLFAELVERQRLDIDD